MLGLEYIFCGVFVLCWALFGKRNTAPWWAWALIGLVVWWLPFGLFALIGEGMGLVGGILGQVIAGGVMIYKSYNKEHKTALHTFKKIEEKTKGYKRPSD